MKDLQPFWNRDYSVLICCHPDCQYGVPINQTVRHLRVQHQITECSVKWIEERVCQVIASSNIPNPSLPTDIIIPIKDLKVYPGFKCMTTTCRTFSISAKYMQMHGQKVHGKSNHWIATHLQTFSRSNKAQYFEVQGYQQSPEITTDVERLSTAENDQINQLVRQYDQRKQKELDSMQLSSSALHTKDLTPWLKLTGFAQHLNGVNKPKLFESLTLPKKLQEPQHEASSLFLSFNRLFGKLWNATEGIPSHILEWTESVQPGAS